MGDDRGLARHLALEGARLVLLGVPPGTEFGIDVNFWNVGVKFKGVKMIPPGLHFIYYSAVNRQGDTAPRTGFFHVFRAREILVKHYDPATEDLKAEEASPDEVDRIRSNIREVDSFLGPYPLKSWKKWISLTQHVEEEEMKSMIPLSGRICSAAELTPVAGFTSSRTNRHTHTPTQTHTDTDTDTPTTSNTPTPTPTPTDTEMHTTDTQTNTHTPMPTLPPPDTPTPPPTVPQLPEMVPREGTEFRFTRPPKKAYREGASPGEVTRYSLDSSFTLRHMISQVQRAESLLAELQLSFVCFLVGQVWDAWEHWRKLLGELCRAEEVLLERPDLFCKMLSVLHYQVNEIPEDLFVDIVESNNFLASSLTALFANVKDNAAALPPPLVLKTHRFKAHLTAKFEWDFNLGDEGEYAPVVVMTT